MSLRANIVANYLGQGWTALMQLAFIPLYIKYLGMEAYGLIGIFAVLQAALTVLDMGIMPTLNREMARFTAGAHSSHSIRELLKSLEIVSVGLAFVILTCIWVGSDWFAQRWLHAEQLPLVVVSKAIVIMGLLAALRFVESIYRGAILGLQAQVWLNAVTATVATARGLGAVGVLAWVSPSIVAFFFWQVFISLVTVIALAVRVHRTLPAAAQPVHFSKLALSRVWNFAWGMIATSFLSLLLTQTDKILLSRLLSLEAFGTYTLAATVGNALLALLVGPLGQSYAPYFTKLLTRQDEPGLIAAYHQGSQLMTVMIVPAALLLIFHGETVVYLWTGNPTLAHNSAALVTLLALGSTFLGLMYIPYMLQLAYGWSTFAAKVNAVLVVVLIPVLFWATPRYGAVGAAWVWVAITSSHIFIVIHMMHRRLLPKEKWGWYWRDNALPAAAAFCVAFAGIWIHPEASSKLGQLGWLIGIGVASFLAAIAFAPDLTKRIVAMIQDRNGIHA